MAFRPSQERKMEFRPSKATHLTRMKARQEFEKVLNLLEVVSNLRKVDLEPIKTLDIFCISPDRDSLAGTRINMGNDEISTHDIFLKAIVSIASLWKAETNRNNRVIFRRIESWTKTHELTLEQLMDMTECNSLATYFYRHLRHSVIFQKIYIISDRRYGSSFLCRLNIFNMSEMEENTATGRAEAQAEAKMEDAYSLFEDYVITDDNKVSSKSEKERSVSGDFDKLSQNITFETVLSEDDEDEVLDNISNLKSVETRGSVSGCLYDKNDDLCKRVTFATVRNEEKEEDVSDMPKLRSLEIEEGSVSVNKMQVSFNIENVNVYESKESVSGNDRDYFEKKSVIGNDEDYSNDEGNDYFCYDNKIENDGVNYYSSDDDGGYHYSFERDDENYDDENYYDDGDKYYDYHGYDEGEDENYFEPDDYDDYYESQGEDENYFDNGYDSYEE